MIWLYPGFPSKWAPRCQTRLMEVRGWLRVSLKQNSNPLGCFANFPESRYQLLHGFVTAVFSVNLSVTSFRNRRDPRISFSFLHFFILSSLLIIFSLSLKIIQNSETGWCSSGLSILYCLLISLIFFLLIWNKSLYDLVNNVRVISLNPRLSDYCCQCFNRLSGFPQSYFQNLVYIEFEFLPLVLVFGCRPLDSLGGSFISALRSWGKRLGSGGAF